MYIWVTRYSASLPEVFFFLSLFFCCTLSLQRTRMVAGLVSCSSSPRSSLKSGSAGCPDVCVLGGGGGSRGRGAQS